ncbi:hypothetical protein D3C76_1255840 [compost metagenome]
MNISEMDQSILNDVTVGQPRSKEELEEVKNNILKLSEQAGVPVIFNRSWIVIEGTNYRRAQAVKVLNRRLYEGWRGPRLGADGCLLPN